MPRLSFRSAILVIVLLGVIWGGYRVSKFAYFALSPAGANPDEATTKLVVEIPKGEPPPKFARFLKEEGIITSSRRFLRLGQLLGKWESVKAGEYELSASMTPLQIFEVITSGVSMSHSITIQEGRNLYQIADRLESKRLASKKKFVSLCKDPEFMKALGFRAPLPPSLEGYLFPDTYFLNRTMDEKDILRNMVARFKKEWTAEFSNRSRELKLTRHEVVTLASIIEKETGAPHERPLISSVFHNRLRKRMRLQSDPTTIYGMWHRYKGNIRRSDLTEKNDYNTYKMSGLPIGAIANPGKEALHAALYPKKSPYLYFVSKNDGTHEFTLNFKDHSEAVRRYQLNRKARQGKSWRDLTKKKKQ